MKAFHEIEWDEFNIDKIEGHGVGAYEVEEAFEAPYVLLRGKKKRRPGRMERRMVLLGRTLGGRYVFIVFEDKGGGRARPISARDMEDDERRLYEEKVG